MSISIGRMMRVTRANFIGDAGGAVCLPKAISFLGKILSNSSFALEKLLGHPNGFSLPMGLDIHPFSWSLL